MKRNAADIDELLKRSLPSASYDRAEAAKLRVYKRLRSNAVDDIAEVNSDLGATTTRPARRWLAATAIAASIAILAIWIGRGSKDHRVFAQPVEGLLYRATARNTDPLRTGEWIEPGDILRTNEYSSAMFRLPDGSRVEMRSNSELSLDSEKDGIRIRLKKGAVVVDASGAASHSPEREPVHVVTNTVTASALAAGFLVHIKETTTLVAAIWGEVRVDQGGEITTLQPGMQTSTSSMGPASLSEELTWSRIAPANIATLEQANRLDSASSSQTASQTGDTSIQRLLSPARSNGAEHTPGRNEQKDGRTAAMTDPWAEGKRILNRSCSSCHSVSFVYDRILAGRGQQRFSTRSDYEDLVTAENARGAGVSEAETEPLVEWLSRFSGYR